VFASAEACYQQALKYIINTHKYERKENEIIIIPITITNQRLAEDENDGLGFFLQYIFNFRS
jgi:hypothetical protein